ARARPREEVYVGPHVARAPDIVVELALDAGYGLSLVATPWHAERLESVRSLADDELAGGRGRGMNGTHRPEGILIATGDLELARSAAAPASIVDVAPTILDALGIRSDAERDGVSMAREHVAYSSDEQALVAARLRALGYLE
ncbi:MAG: hypothetical protein JSU66_11080, partial [Deltaproteobacteria bacterium]